MAASPTWSVSRSARRRIPLWRLAGYLAMVAVVAIIGAPIFWMVTGALKTTSQIYTFPPIWIPTDPRWDNFTRAWNIAPFGRFYLNSLIITFAGTGLELINATLTAYALAYLRFPLKNVIFVIILAALMIPNQVTILPNYLTLSNFFGQNWINTYQGIVLPGAAVAFGTFLMRQAFLGLPREVLESARLEGCSHVRLLWDHVIPMARPVLITFGLISMVAKWNDYLWPLVVTNEQRMRPLAVGISYLFNPENNTDWGMVMAATVFVIAPLLVVFMWAQRFVIDGITAGATKG